MDWYSWLCESSSLGPSLASEYALVLSRNELEETDIAYFDHEFLQSMGIDVAKHRLEILKLAKKHLAVRPVVRLLDSVRRTKKRLSKYVYSLAHRSRDGSAIVAAPHAGGGSGSGSGSGSARWAGLLLRRHRRRRSGRLTLPDGGAKVADTRLASPAVYKNGSQELRWDTMFADLKPT